METYPSLYSVFNTAAVVLIMSANSNLKGTTVWYRLMSMAILCILLAVGFLTYWALVQ